MFLNEIVLVAHCLWQEQNFDSKDSVPLHEGDPLYDVLDLFPAQECTLWFSLSTRGWRHIFFYAACES